MTIPNERWRSMINTASDSSVREKREARGDSIKLALAKFVN